MKKERVEVEDWNEDFEESEDEFELNKSIREPTDEEIESVSEDEEDETNLQFIHESDDEDDDFDSSNFHHHQWSGLRLSKQEDVPWDEAFSSCDDEDWSWRP